MFSFCDWLLLDLYYFYKYVILSYCNFTFMSKLSTVLFNIEIRVLFVNLIRNTVQNSYIGFYFDTQTIVYRAMPDTIFTMAAFNLFNVMLKYFVTQVYLSNKTITLSRCQSIYSLSLRIQKICNTRNIECYLCYPPINDQAALTTWMKAKYYFRLTYRLFDTDNKIVSK